MERKDRSDYKTLWLHKNTHKQITNYGSKDETYDEILKKILKVYKKYLDHDLIESNTFSIDGKPDQRA